MLYWHGASVSRTLGVSPFMESHSTDEFDVLKCFMKPSIADKPDAEGKPAEKCACNAMSE